MSGEVVKRMEEKLDKIILDIADIKLKMALIQQKLEKQEEEFVKKIDCQKKTSTLKFYIFCVFLISIGALSAKFLEILKHVILRFL